MVWTGEYHYGRKSLTIPIVHFALSATKNNCANIDGLDWRIPSRTKAPHRSNSAFYTKNDRFCPGNHQVVEQLISFEISCNTKSKALMTC